MVVNIIPVTHESLFVCQVFENKISSTAFHMKNTWEIILKEMYHKKII